jgi:hypothetical protein
MVHENGERVGGLVVVHVDAAPLLDLGEGGDVGAEVERGCGLGNGNSCEKWDESEGQEKTREIFGGHRSSGKTFYNMRFAFACL